MMVDLTCCVHHHLPSAPSLNVGDTNEREEEIGDAIAGSKKTSEAVLESNALGEHGG